MSILGKRVSEMLHEKKRFLKTGSTLTDASLGGGLWEDHIINVIGDSGVGKTAFALSCGAMRQRKDKGFIVFEDAENALERVHGLKSFKIDGDEMIERSVQTVDNYMPTVENFWEGLKLTCAKAKAENRPALYILDSLDSLGTNRGMPDLDKLEKDFKDMGADEEPKKKEKKKGKDGKEEDDGEGYSMRDKLEKSIVMSFILSKMTHLLVKARVTLIIISQTRTKIGVTFGDPKDISCGGALKFYCVQRVKLAEISQIKDAKKHPQGINTVVKIIKNKAWEPFHTASYPLYFHTGINDIESCIDYIRKNSSMMGKSSSYEFNGFKHQGKEAFTQHFYSSRTDLIRLKKMAKDLWFETEGTAPEEPQSEEVSQ